MCSRTATAACAFIAWKAFANPSFAIAETFVAALAVKVCFVPMFGSSFPGITVFCESQLAHVACYIVNALDHKVGWWTETPVRWQRAIAWNTLYENRRVKAYSFSTVFKSTRFSCELVAWSIRVEYNDARANYAGFQERTIKISPWWIDKGSPESARSLGTVSTNPIVEALREYRNDWSKTFLIIMPKKKRKTAQKEKRNT